MEYFFTNANDTEAVSLPVKSTTESFISTDYTICPVCKGRGTVLKTKEEKKDE